MPNNRRGQRLSRWNHSTAEQNLINQELLARPSWRRGDGLPAANTGQGQQQYQPPMMNAIGKKNALVTSGTTKDEKRESSASVAEANPAVSFAGSFGQHGTVASRIGQNIPKHRAQNPVKLPGPWNKPDKGKGVARRFNAVAGNSEAGPSSINNLPRPYSAPGRFGAVPVPTAQYGPFDEIPNNGNRSFQAGLDSTGGQRAHSRQPSYCPGYPNAPPSAYTNAIQSSGGGPSIEPRHGSAIEYEPAIPQYGIGPLQNPQALNWVQYQSGSPNFDGKMPSSSSNRTTQACISQGSSPRALVVDYKAMQSVYAPDAPDATITINGDGFSFDNLPLKNFAMCCGLYREISLTRPQIEEVYFKNLTYDEVGVVVSYCTNFRLDLLPLDLINPVAIHKSCKTLSKLGDVFVIPQFHILMSQILAGHLRIMEDEILEARNANIRNGVPNASIIDPDYARCLVEGIKDCITQSEDGESPLTPGGMLRRNAYNGTWSPTTMRYLFMDSLFLDMIKEVPLYFCHQEARIAGQYGTAPQGV